MVRTKDLEPTTIGIVKSISTSWFMKIRMDKHKVMPTEVWIELVLTSNRLIDQNPITHVMPKLNDIASTNGVINKNTHFKSIKKYE